MALKLGVLKNLKLRTVWGHEERDFTPWLAEEQHLAALSDAIGMDLQLERTEMPVGPYSADILAKDASGAFVVIENQFGKTNHDHLGKLLTYGATLGVSAVVWIAEEFTEEHRKAIDWLNERTTDDLSLYGVILEVLQIDDSPPAIRYNVVCQPNEVVRAAVAARASGELTEAQRIQLDFWTMFRARLLERKVVTSAQTPRPQYWFDIPTGRSNIVISNIVDTSAGRIGARIYIGNHVASMALPQLERDREAIEREIGEQLVWNPFPNKRDKTIGLFRQVNLEDRESWPEYCDWLIQTVIKFRGAFIPRVKALNLSAVEVDHQ